MINGIDLNPETSERELVFKRLFNASRTLVFDAWTKKEYVDKWWGPAGFRNETLLMDVKPGGIWRFMMNGPDGTQFPNRIVYQEVIRPEKLTFLHGEDKDNDPQAFHVTVTFAELGNQTEITMTMLFPTKEQKQLVVEQYGAVEGNKQTMDRLGQFLLELESGDREIVSKRTFGFPVTTVFKAFSDPDLLARWWGPAGFTNTFHQFDFRRDGVWDFDMYGPDGKKYHNKSVFEEVLENERIVFRHVTGHLFQAVFTFTETVGKTELVFRMIFETAREKEKIKAIVVPSNEENFDRLQAVLQKVAGLNPDDLVIERTLPAPPERVWKAISTKEEMKKWYFDLEEFKAEKGFVFRFEDGPEDKEPYLHICEVTEVVPHKKLTYSWRYEGYEGISYVTFELFQVNDGTRLRLTHSGLNSFPASNPDLARSNFEAGWTDIIGKSLPAYLS